MNLASWEILRLSLGIRNWKIIEVNGEVSIDAIDMFDYNREIPIRTVKKHHPKSSRLQRSHQSIHLKLSQNKHAILSSGNETWFARKSSH